MAAEGSWGQRLHIDGPLLCALVLLGGVGLVVVYSAGGRDVHLVMRQAVRLAVALAVLLLIAQVSPRQLLRWSPWFYLATLVLLGAVLAFGHEGKGAQRWISFEGFRFQPSELAKIAVPMMVASFVSEHPLPVTFIRAVICMLLVLLPVGLVARQPDLGTALLVGSSGAFVLFIAGLSWRVILAGLGSIAGAAPVIWSFMHDYQRRRVLTFLDPEQDPLGAGYHTIQAEIAVGSGGLYGKGWLNGTQSQLDFLPERKTDFIFAVFSEEFGLLGVVGLLSIYGFIIGRGLYLAWNSQDLYARLLAIALVLTFFVYVFVNVGMVTGLLPVVGVPLPLISYGGTSLVTLMSAFGILMSAHTHRRLLSD